MNNIYLSRTIALRSNMFACDLRELIDMNVYCKTEEELNSLHAICMHMLAWVKQNRRPANEAPLYVAMNFSLADTDLREFVYKKLHYDIWQKCLELADQYNEYEICYAAIANEYLEAECDSVPQAVSMLATLLLELNNFRLFPLRTAVYNAGRGNFTLDHLACYTNNDMDCYNDSGLTFDYYSSDFLDMSLAQLRFTDFNQFSGYPLNASHVNFHFDSLRYCDHFIFDKEEKYDRIFAKLEEPSTYDYEAFDNAQDTVKLPIAHTHASVPFSLLKDSCCAQWLDAITIVNHLRGKKSKAVVLMNSSSITNANSLELRNIFAKLGLIETIIKLPDNFNTNNAYSCYLVVLSFDNEQPRFLDVSNLGVKWKRAQIDTNKAVYAIIDRYQQQRAQVIDLSQENFLIDDHLVFSAT